MKSIVSIGMDVHKNSFNLCAYNKITGEIMAETRCEADTKLVQKFIDNIKKKNNDESLEFKCGYEAGCLGYSVYRQLSARGIDCDILAPTTMSCSQKNKKVKNDKRDAKNIAENLANGTYKAVHVPDEDDVEIKEYIRMVSDIKRERKKIKQEILAFILRHGFQFDGSSKWTIKHMDWLRNLEMSVIMRETLNEYMAVLESLNDKIDRFESRIDDFYQMEKYHGKVSELRCFKGIDTVSAMTIHVETADFARFPNAQAFSSYTGLTCGEHSSGDKDNRTSITKQGNTILRKTFVESAQALVKGNVYSKKSKRLRARQKGISASVITYADRATERLMRKYNKMKDRGIPHNKAIVAVARELACFVWGMETGNIHA